MCRRITAWPADAPPNIFWMPGTRKSGYSRPDAFWQEEQDFGTRDAMRQAGLDDDNLAVLRATPAIEGDLPQHPQAVHEGSALIEAAEGLFRAGTTGIIAVNDWVAIGAARSLSKIGLVLGQDLRPGQFRRSGNCSPKHDIELPLPVGNSSVPRRELSQCGPRPAKTCSTACASSDESVARHSSRRPAANSTLLRA